MLLPITAIMLYYQPIRFKTKMNHDLCYARLLALGAGCIFPTLCSSGCMLSRATIGTGCIKCSGCNFFHCLGWWLFFVSSLTGTLSNLHWLATHDFSTATVFRKPLSHILCCLPCHTSQWLVVSCAAISWIRDKQCYVLIAQTKLEGQDSMGSSLILNLCFDENVRELLFCCCCRSNVVSNLKKELSTCKGQFTSEK